MDGRSLPRGRRTISPTVPRTLRPTRPLPARSGTAVTACPRRRTPPAHRSAVEHLRLGRTLRGEGTAGLRRPGRVPVDRHGRGLREVRVGQQAAGSRQQAAQDEGRGPHPPLPDVQPCGVQGLHQRLRREAHDVEPRAAPREPARCARRASRWPAGAPPAPRATRRSPAGAVRCCRSRPRSPAPVVTRCCRPTPDISRPVGSRLRSLPGDRTPGTATPGTAPARRASGPW